MSVLLREKRNSVSTSRPTLFTMARTLPTLPTDGAYATEAADVTYRCYLPTALFWKPGIRPRCVWCTIGGVYRATRTWPSFGPTTALGSAQPGSNTAKCPPRVILTYTDCSARGPGIESCCGQLCLSHNHCDLQPWARAVYTLPAVPRSTQPSTLRGTVIK